LLIIPIMLRRLSTTFKKSKGDHDSKENGAQGSSKRRSMLSPMRRKSAQEEEEEENHSANRDDVDLLFGKYAQLIHASRRPLPSQNGDGTYVEHETSTGLFQDLKTMGFKDFATLKDVLGNELSGELVDDRTMLMERVIQVMSTCGGSAISC
jgi:linoleate 10R-lipoxygenase